METTLRSRASAIDPRLRLLRTDLLWQARLLGRGRVKETALRLLPLHWLRRPGLPLPPDFGACSGHWYHRLERHLRSKPRSADALKSGERRVTSTRGGMLPGSGSRGPICAASPGSCPRAALEPGESPRGPIEVAVFSRPSATTRSA